MVVNASNRNIANVQRDSLACTVNKILMNVSPISHAIRHASTHMVHFIVCAARVSHCKPINRVAKRIFDCMVTMAMVMHSKPETWKMMWTLRIWVQKSIIWKKCVVDILTKNCEIAIRQFCFTQFSMRIFFQIIIAEKHRNVESTKQMHSTMETVKSLRLRLDGMVWTNVTLAVTSIFILNNAPKFSHLQENRQNEVNALRDKLNTFEAQAQKLEYTVDLLYKCRFNPTNYYCPWGMPYQIATKLVPMPLHLLYYTNIYV